MPGSGEFEENFVAIDADYLSMRCNSLGNARRNCTGATADIQHGKSRPQQFSQAAVVSLQGSTAENSRIGAV